MGRIHVLSDQVANKIAAGEVVERPASVVKELVENSLDAGATSLRIEVESGGRRLVRVADDGGGMLRDDALLAFERHATSKLRDVKDLVSIATLGFRGEALPSIGAVSRLLLESRSPEEATGMRIEMAGGKLLRADETALAPGTTVTVRDLFFNVPARRKFLRTEQTELAHIASLVTQYSLANPDKTFELRSGAAELLAVTPVASRRERVYQIFGSQVLEELVELGPCERQLLLPAPSVPPGEAIGEFRRGPQEPPSRSFRLGGFVSRPQVQKANRNSIFIFVNGRLIRDRLLLHAISSAYYNLMPPSCFPFALLFLECDCEEVDVNVHPAKTEVRFRHGPFVHDFVRDAIRETLIQSRPAPAFRISTPPQPAAVLPYSEFSQAIEAQPFSAPSGLSQPVPPDAPVPPAQAAGMPEFTLRPDSAPPPRLPFDGPPIDVTGRPEDGSLKLPVPESHGDFLRAAAPDRPVSLAALADLRSMGQIHESFIVAAGPDGLWIIDQHVAHERILFEKILEQQAAGRVEVQRLLVPSVLELTPAQLVEYARIAGELEAAGFETEPFGPRAIAVKGCPAGVAASDLEPLIFEILEISEAELRGRSLQDLRRALAASIACRAAIKVNTRLEPGKIEWLLAELGRTQYPMSCPHGRPIALHYSTREILKAFKRI
ncbi:MAG: DNA mismatch repair endonuclease MutL [Bryobacterales bacterium]|nr:DNA mismatch repair endonuclease MutL [Bryobacterales bacterium]